MAEKEKGFDLKLYAAVSTVVVAAVLVLIVTFTFKSKYTAFHPEDVAKNYVDTIVQTGDGYNAYKSTLLCKNKKYGNFVREQYIYPVIFNEAGYTPGDDVKKLKGFNDASYKGEKTQSDNGALQGQLIDAMYPVYEKLVADGWDGYDNFFRMYFAELAKCREEIFGDKYMTDEIMFTALESNVKTYGEHLTGTEDAFDKNTGEQTSVKTVGVYQTAYGEDYRLTAACVGEKNVDLAEYKAGLDGDSLGVYGISADDISDVRCFTVEVTANDDKTVASADVTVVKIGSSWYVDPAVTDTSVLYTFVQ